MSSTSKLDYSAATVIDGLVFFSDGSNRDMLAGGVTAMNLTVTEMTADFEEAVKDLVRWRRHCRTTPGWVLVETADDIDRAKKEGALGLIMGWQNAKPIGDQLDRIELFHDLGLRILQLTYNEANLLGDGCLEARNGGLSTLGIKAVEELNRVGVAIDVSHCVEQTCLDACAHSTRPVLLTHANANAVVRRPRNKSDEVIRAVARTGGVIGCSIHGYLNWGGDPNEQSSLKNFVANIRHVGNLAGYEHVGIGTDFPSVDNYDAVMHVMVMSRTKYPGSGGDLARAFGDVMEARYPKETPTPAQFPVLAQALEDSGLTHDQILDVLGRNFQRVLKECWKPASTTLQ